MKKKDIIALVFAALIIMVAGYIAYTQLLAPKGGSKSSGGTSVEVIGSIPSSLDQSAVDTLSDPTKVQDFTPTIDLSTGIGTTAPFSN